MGMEGLVLSYRDGVCDVGRRTAALTHCLSAGADSHVHAGLAEEGVYRRHIWQLGLTSEAIVIGDGCWPLLDGRFPTDLKEILDSDTWYYCVRCNFTGLGG